MQQNQTPESLIAETAPDTDAVSPAPTLEADATATVEVMPSLEELLKAAELKAAEHHDAWLRAKAEGENIRRRVERFRYSAAIFPADGG